MMMSNRLIGGMGSGFPKGIVLGKIILFAKKKRMKTQIYFFHACYADFMDWASLTTCKKQYWYFFLYNF